MRKFILILFAFAFLITSTCYAAWKFNPHTGKLDYYESDTVGSSFDGTSPNAVLYIKSGNTAASSSLIVTDGSKLTVGVGTTQTGASLTIRGAGTSTGFALRIADSTPTDRLVVLDNGNVGIGTTAPVALLQVAGTSPAVQNLTVLSNGNVGIGTTAPARRLQVVGDYARIGDGGTISYADGDGDLYIEDELEVDGVAEFAGTTTFRGSGGIVVSIGEIQANGGLVVQDNDPLTFGWNQIVWDTNYQPNDSMVIRVKCNNSSYSGNLLIIEQNDFSTDFKLPLVIDPHLRIQSSDATSVNDYIQFWHDQTDANIQTGSGRLNIISGSTAPTDLLYIRSAGTGTNMALRIANTTPTDILAVLDNQRVGIGTTLPTARLEILPADTTPAESLYINIAGSRIIMKSPDASCSACGVDNSDVWSCTSVTCP